MAKLKELYDKWFGEKSSRFIRFSLVGAIWTVFNIGIMWLLIDLWHLPGWLGSSIGIIILYIGRYYHYLWLKVIAPHFWKYVYASGIFSVFMVGAMTVAVDILHFKALPSSIVATAASFILKYLFFKQIKLILPKKDG